AARPSKPSAGGGRRQSFQPRLHASARARSPPAPHRPWKTPMQSACSWSSPASPPPATCRRPAADFGPYATVLAGEGRERLAPATLRTIVRPHEARGGPHHGEDRL